MNNFNLSFLDLLIVFFSGVGASLVGFILTMLWEWKKIKKQEDLVIEILKQELLSNKAMLKNNLDNINQELKVIDQKQSLVGPLNMLNADFMNLLFISMPKIFEKNPNLLSKINDLSRFTKENNETINSRETYRMNNGAMSNFNSHIKLYDQILQRQINKLLKLTEELFTQIQDKTPWIIPRGLSLIRKFFTDVFCDIAK